MFAAIGGPSASRNLSQNQIIRTVTAILAEQHDEWAEGRRYLGLDVMTRARGADEPEPAKEATTDPTLQAITA